MTEKKKRGLPTLEDAQAAFAKIPKTWILAFVAACIVFIVFHAGYFDDRMVNEDYRHYIIRNTEGTLNYSTGRFLHFRLTNEYVNSWFLGCTACLFMAMSAVLIVDLFRIRTKLGIVLSTVLLVGMPAVSYMFSFLFSVTYYTGGYFLAILAVWVADRWRRGVIPATVIFAIALAVLQSTLVAAPVLCVLVLLRDLLFGEELDYKTLLRKVLKFLIMGIVGVLLYFAVWRLLRHIYHVEISTYRGMDKLWQFEFKTMAKALLNSYKDVWSFFFGTGYFYTSTIQKIAYAVLLASCAFACIYAVAKKTVRIVGLLIGIMLLPPCLGSIAILVPAMETDTHLIYSIVYAMIFSIHLAENSMPDNSIGRGSAWLLIVSLLATCISFLDVTSAFYVKSETYHEHTAAYENRLLSRIESTPGYYAGIPVAILWDSTNEYRGMSSNDFSHVINDRDMWYSYVGSYTNNMKKTIDLIKAYTGVTLTRATDAQVQQSRLSAEFREMTPFPLDGSIQVIDGILTVNCVYREIEVMQVDDQTLLLNYIDHVPIDTDAVYAWYVYRNNERVPELERGYRDVPEHLVTLTEDGNYIFKGYCKRGDSTKSVNSTMHVKVENGVVSADYELPKISAEEAFGRALPPVQVGVSLTGDRSVSLEMLENSFHAGADFTFAWRIYRDGEHLEEFDRGFESESKYDVRFAEDGLYRFELIYRDGNGEEVSVMSDEFSVAHELDILRVNDNTVMLDYVGSALEVPGTTYAWYVYKDKEEIKELRRNYMGNPAYLVLMDDNGTYSFKCYINQPGEGKRSISSFWVRMKDGVMAEDIRIGSISQEEASNRSKPEVEVEITLVGDRGVKLTMIDNHLDAGPEYTYAWYVFRNGEQLKEYNRQYDSDPEYDLILAEDGEYQFKLFYRIGDVKSSVMSEKITIGNVQSIQPAA